MKQGVENVTQLVACTSSGPSLPQQHINTTKWYTPSILEVEAGGSEVQDHPWLLRELKTCMGYPRQDPVSTPNQKQTYKPLHSVCGAGKGAL